MKINLLLFIGLILMFWFVKKDSLIQVINRNLPQKEAGLMAGILLGDKTGFEKKFYNDLQRSGLVHLVIVSGSNVMLLIGGLIEQIASYLGRKRSIMFGLMIGWWYVNLVGWEVPALRAMLLLSIVYFAQLVGRKYNIWRGLAVAILIMLLADYRVILSLSFWLSITAYLAIILIKVDEWQKSFWVSVFITPILAISFGKISLISPLANMLVLGIVELITLLGAFGLFWLAIPLLKYLEIVAEWGGKVPYISIEFNWLILVGYYCCLLFYLIKNKEKVNYH